jgi:hypothetical protein
MTFLSLNNAASALPSYLLIMCGTDPGTSSYSKSRNPPSSSHHSPSIHLSSSSSAATTTRSRSHPSSTKDSRVHSRQHLSLTMQPAIESCISRRLATRNAALEAYESCVTNAERNHTRSLTHFDLSSAEDSCFLRISSAMYEPAQESWISCTSRVESNPLLSVVPEDIFDKFQRSPPPYDEQLSMASNYVTQQSVGQSALLHHHPAFRSLFHPNTASITITAFSSIKASITTTDTDPLRLPAPQRLLPLLRPLPPLQMSALLRIPPLLTVSARLWIPVPSRLSLLLQLPPLLRPPAPLRFPPLFQLPILLQILRRAAHGDPRLSTQGVTQSWSLSPSSSPPSSSVVISFLRR